MTDQKVSTSIQHKLMIKLLESDFQPEYKKGKENSVVDALSRKYTLQVISPVTPSWIQEVENSYLNDPTCKSLLETLLLSPGNKCDHDSLHSGVIKHKDRIMVGAQGELKTRLVQALRSSSIGGHSASLQLTTRLKSYFTGQASKQM